MRRAGLGIWMLVVTALLSAQLAVLPAAASSFTTIDHPGASNTQIFGINATGEMVGFADAGVEGAWMGFRLSRGVFTPIDAPQGAEPHGLGPAGDIVGIYQPDVQYGFRLSRTGFQT